MPENILYALLLSLFAGLSTGIGALIPLLARAASKSALSLGMGFSSGVMIYVSLVELLPDSMKTIAEQIAGKNAEWIALTSFFGGMLIIALIDKLVPEPINPHHLHTVEEAYDESLRQKHLMRTGLLTALAIAIHNFPEGIATFMSAVYDPTLGLSIAIAVAIHNIPEGIAVFVPLYFAYNDRKKAFLYAFLSGLAEPLGAVFAYLLLAPYLTPLVFGSVMAAVAGIMVFISLDELIPAALEYGKPHTSVYGIIGGMAIMAVSLVIL